MGALLSVLGFLADVWKVLSAFLFRRSIEKAEDRKVENASLKEEVKDVKAAEDAARAVRDDPASVRDDPDNRDARP